MFYKKEEKLKKKVPQLTKKEEVAIVREMKSSFRNFAGWWKNMEIVRKKGVESLPEKRYK